MDVVADEGSLTITTHGPSETEEVGKALGSLLGRGDVVGLIGDLGTGKTCFTRGIAAGVGVDHAVAVVSPSFTILNEYVGNLVLHHFDFFRLEAPSGDFDLEWRDYFYGDSVVVVEWAEKVAGVLPADRITVNFSFLDDDGREICLKGQGEHCVGIVKRCASRLYSYPC